MHIAIGLKGSQNVKGVMHKSRTMSHHRTDKLLLQISLGMVNTAQDIASKVSHGCLLFREARVLRVPGQVLIGHVNMGV